jgi:hypothetical protein
VSPYARRFNERAERVGHLIQGRYHAVHVGTDVHLRAVVRYVSLNPVEAGLIALSDLERYPWTALSTLCGHVSGPALDLGAVLAAYSLDRTDAIAALRASIGAAWSPSAGGPATMALLDRVADARRELGIDATTLWQSRDAAVITRRRALVREAVGDLALTPAAIARAVGVHRATIGRALGRE